MSRICGFGSWSVGRAGLESVSSWWGRLSEARTGDRDAVADRRVIGFDQLRQFIVASVLEVSIGIGVRGVVQPYLGARAAAVADVARRRDGGWGEPGVGARLLVLSGTTAASGDDRTMEGASREHQLIGTRARTDGRSGRLALRGC